MRYLHNEDLELQIKLAELQAEVHVNLTAFFGFVAGTLTILLAFQQIYFQPELSLDKTVILIGMSAFLFPCLILLILFLKRALVARRDIEGLKKQYVW